MKSHHVLLCLLLTGLCLWPAGPLHSTARADEAASLRQAQEALDKAEYDKAAALLKPLADKDNAEALYVLGRLTLEGKGVKKMSSARPRFSGRQRKRAISAP